MKSLLLTGAAALVLSTAAHADQITVGQLQFGALNDGYDFTGEAGGDLSIAMLAPEIGDAFFQSDPGTYTLGAVSFTAGPLSAAVWPVIGSPTQSFSYLGADGDSLTGTINWGGGEIKDGSSKPDLIAGSFDILSVSGDGDFTSAFVAGETGNFDLTLLPTEIATLESLGILSSHWLIGSGLLDVQGDTVPEPATLGLFGAFLILAWRHMRQHKQNTGPSPF